MSPQEEEESDKLVEKLKITGRSIIDDFDSVIIIATFKQLQESIEGDEK